MASNPGRPRYFHLHWLTPEQNGVGAARCSTNHNQEFANIIKCFLGFDPRETIAFHVCANSIIRNASRPVEIIPLALHLLNGYQELHTDGSNSFIYSRFLVPSLCDFLGKAIFMDGDMVVTGDIAELWDIPDQDAFKALWVVPHDYRTQHVRKYIGSPMESPNDDYPKKNQSSVMVFNCFSSLLKKLTPDYVSKATGSHLHRFEWLPEDRIGHLPPEWNVLAQEQAIDAKIMHYTLGIPGFQHYAYTDQSQPWHEELKHTLRLDGEKPAEMVRRSLSLT